GAGGARLLAGAAGLAAQRSGRRRDGEPAGHRPDAGGRHPAGGPRRAAGVRRSGDRPMSAVGPIVILLLLVAVLVAVLLVGVVTGRIGDGIDLPERPRRARRARRSRDLR